MKKNNVAQTWLLIAAVLYSIIGHAPSVFAHGAFTGPTEAEQHINCRIDSAAGAFSEAQSTYTVKGDCQVTTKQPDPKGGSTFGDVTDQFNWTAVGTYQPGKYNTTETIAVRKWNANPSAPPLATIFSTMLCRQDPWLRPDGLSCGSVQYQQTSTLGSETLDGYVQSYLTQTNPVVPRSSMLNPQQRAALNQEYQSQLVATLNSKNKAAQMPPKLPATATTTPANPNNTNRIFQASAPVITLPIANTANFEGRFQVKARVPGSYTGAEGVYVQFTYLGNATTPNQNSFVNIFNITLKDLVNGITVPTYITRGGQGRWLVRAQIITPNAGPWSAAVPFIVSQLSSTNVTPSLNKK